MMSQVAEIIIFILLGVTCVEGLIHSISWNTALFFVTLLTITVFRFLSVFLLTFILNFTRKEIVSTSFHGPYHMVPNFKIPVLPWNPWHGWPIEIGERFSEADWYKRPVDYSCKWSSRRNCILVDKTCHPKCHPTNWYIYVNNNCNYFVHFIFTRWCYFISGRQFENRKSRTRTNCTTTQAQCCWKYSLHWKYAHQVSSIIYLN